MERRIGKVWIATLLCGVVFLSFVSCQKKEQTQRIEIAEQTEGKEAEVKEEPIFEERDLQNSSTAKSGKETVSIPAKITLRLSNEPRLGETVDLIFTITPSEDVPEMSVDFDMLKGVELAGGEKVTKSSAKKNETKEFVIKVKFISPPVALGVKAKGTAKSAEGKRLPLNRGGILRRYIIDEKTKQFGSLGQKLERMPEYRYDIASGEIFPPGEYLGSGVYAREMIERLKKIEPQLTDWEAIYLHRDALRILWKGVYAGTDDERCKWLLEKGWLEKQREGEVEKEKWLEELIQRKLEGQKKSKGEEGGLFIPNEEDSSLTTRLPDTLTIFRGQFKFKKHLYDTTGLQIATVDKPIRKAKLWIWAYWFDSGGKQRMAPPVITDDNGNFEVRTYGIPSSAQQVSAEPVIYPWGPSLTPPEVNRIKVSDPNPSYAYSDPGDSSVWWLRRTDSPPADSVWPGGTFDFGVVYVETLRVGIVDQPRSGAENIYNAFLEGYEKLVPTYTTPDTILKVRAIWEPGYTVGTYIDTSSGDTDTIYVLGVDTVDTDEWDDPVLLHEFGHHVIYRCAEMGPNIAGSHFWWENDTTQPNQAYNEGWPTFFSSIVRDTVYYIDTDHGIGGNSIALWRNIEDPWIFSSFPPDSFEGGPWCEGAVAGVLWDIYDFIDEIPYPPYTDSNLTDTLRLGFSNIWNITDDYDPVCDPIRPWTIFDFLAGWDSFNYAHDIRMEQILTHHRTNADSFKPDGPDTLRARVQPGRDSTSLVWKPSNLSSNPCRGYFVYRKEPQDSVFIKIAQVLDTTYSDSTVIRDRIYSYAVTAFDSLRIESDTSNNVTTWVPGSSNSGATAFNNGRKMVRDTTGTIFVTLTSGDSVLVGWTANRDSTWKKVFIGLGKSPSIAMSPTNLPWVFWIGSADDHVIYYSIFDTTGIWSLPSPLHTFPTNLSFYSLSSVFGPGYGHITVDGDINDADCGLCRSSYYLRFDTSLLQKLVSKFRGNEHATSTLAHSSVDSDILDNPHIVWDYRQWPDFGIIYYRTGIVVSPDSIDWAPPFPISNPLVNSAFPFVDEDNGTIHAVWQGDSGNWEIFHNFLPDSIWRGVIPVTGTAVPSIYPVITSGKYAVFVEGSDIAYSTFDGSSWDLIPTPIRETPDVSNHCHALFNQTPTDTNLIVTWTEGDTTITTEPFSIELEFKNDPGGLLLKYYVDCGQVTPSPYTHQRAGYGRWGEEPSKTIDYHLEELMYNFDGLDPMERYTIKAVFYYEDDPENFIFDPGSGNLQVAIPSTFSMNNLEDKENDIEPLPNRATTLGRSTNWEMGLEVNGLPLGTVNIKSKEPSTLIGVIPNGGCSDGRMTCSITRKAGDYALLAELYLFEGNSSVMSDVTLLNPLPKVFTLRQNFPNPFKVKTTIQYQLPKDSQVSLKIYNIAGQHVKTLTNRTERPGYYTVPWDGKDREGKGVPSGVYFYRFVALDVENKSQQFYSTKKIVYLR